MNYIIRIYIYCFLFCTFLVESTIYAQGPPDPGGGGGGPGPVGMGPIDGGIEIAIVLGVVYGVKKFFKNKKNKI